MWWIRAVDHQGREITLNDRDWGAVWTSIEAFLQHTRCHYQQDLKDAIFTAIRKLDEALCDMEVHGQAGGYKDPGGLFQIYWARKEISHEHKPQAHPAPENKGLENARRGRIRRAPRKIRKLPYRRGSVHS